MRSLRFASPGLDASETLSRNSRSSFSPANSLPEKVRAHMRRLILSSRQSPGDILMLTAAVRELHRSHPGQFATDVRTPVPELWTNNPYLTPLDTREAGVESIEMHSR